jgi:FKBP-type peptidyl-prolyl cis-trans isomerase 2
MSRPETKPVDVTPEEGYCARRGETKQAEPAKTFTQEVDALVQKRLVKKEARSS